MKALTQWVKFEAALAAKRAGFGMRPCADAPNDFQELLAAYAVSKRTGQLLPVFSGASDDTIYADRLGNWSFRFWHDLCHVEQCADFSIGGELAALVPQLDRCRETFGAHSVEYRAFYADTVGQVLAYPHVGFVERQREFVEFVVEHSRPNVKSTTAAAKLWAHRVRVAA